ncbi:hypothetical protein AArcMg_4067 (plasmid) [Natrarchaeobaculum sulfurireducens]|uniref:Uncharacterized protein n=1 Tax=Natrarchaeobaculum sulfurireducens TaxID=2044521 RepID=A0A346PK47_9EURY|nr:hypothetical protein AArcMg_4067 [Natrarchaeobaculum sulfurireducens]
MDGLASRGYIVRSVVVGPNEGTALEVLPRTSGVSSSSGFLDQHHSWIKEEHISAPALTPVSLDIGIPVEYVRPKYTS